MARSLKTFQTSMGFFDLAVAAPSMKAALEAWGSKMNLFHHGLARETHEAAVVGATLARPGVVLKRPVGTNDVFKEHADLPESLPDTPHPHKSVKASKRAVGVDRKKAAQEYERGEKKRERELAQEKTEQDRRREAIAEAEALLAAALERHEAVATELNAERHKLDKQLQSENDRWSAQRDQLREAVRLARKS